MRSFDTSKLSQSWQLGLFALYRFLGYHSHLGNDLGIQRH